MTNTPYLHKKIKRKGEEKMQINKENTKNILKEIESKSNLVIPFNEQDINNFSKLYNKDLTKKQYKECLVDFLLNNDTLETIADEFYQNYLTEALKRYPENKETYLSQTFKDVVRNLIAYNTEISINGDLSDLKNIAKYCFYKHTLIANLKRKNNQITNEAIRYLVDQDIDEKCWNIYNYDELDQLEQYITDKYNLQNKA